MTQSPSDGPQDQERTPHPEDPAEGATTGQHEETDIPRAHSEDPAEGADDESALS
jgi:hypothetical protein